MAGREQALEGLQAVIAGDERVAATRNTPTEALARYRVWLFGQGEEREGTDPHGTPLRLGFKREDVLAVVAARGRLAVPDYLRLRVRYFADGAVLGTRGFVNEVFTSLRHRFGPKRSDGARRMRGLIPELFSLRDLRQTPFG